MKLPPAQPSSRFRPVAFAHWLYVITRLQVSKQSRSHWTMPPPMPPPLPPLDQPSNPQSNYATPLGLARKLGDSKVRQRAEAEAVAHAMHLLRGGAHLQQQAKLEAKARLMVSTVELALCEADDRARKLAAMKLICSPTLLCPAPAGWPPGWVERDEATEVDFVEAWPRVMATTTTPALRAGRDPRRSRDEQCTADTIPARSPSPSRIAEALHFSGGIQERIASPSTYRPSFGAPLSATKRVPRRDGSPPGYLLSCDAGSPPGWSEEGVMDTPLTLECISLPCSPNHQRDESLASYTPHHLGGLTFVSARVRV